MRGGLKIRTAVLYRVFSAPPIPRGICNNHISKFTSTLHSGCDASHENKFWPKRFDHLSRKNRSGCHPHSRCARGVHRVRLPPCRELSSRVQRHVTWALEFLPLPPQASHCLQFHW